MRDEETIRQKLNYVEGRRSNARTSGLTAHFEAMGATLEWVLGEREEL